VRKLSVAYRSRTLQQAQGEEKILIFLTDSSSRAEGAAIHVSARQSPIARHTDRRAQALLREAQNAELAVTSD
jgi:hypothetical protein